MGIVLVARCAARAEVVVVTTITSTPSRLLKNPTLGIGSA
jgi:hypothetical protein